MRKLVAALATAVIELGAAALAPKAEAAVSPGLASTLKSDAKAGSVVEQVHRRWRRGGLNFSFGFGYPRYYGYGYSPYYGYASPYYYGTPYYYSSPRYYYKKRKYRRWRH